MARANPDPSKKSRFFVLGSSFLVRSWFTVLGAKPERSALHVTSLLVRSRSRTAPVGRTGNEAPRTEQEPRMRNQEHAGILSDQGELVPARSSAPREPPSEARQSFGFNGRSEEHTSEL